MFLAVIKPPNNAETVLLRMKHEFFQRTGIVSSWALTPIVPLAVFKAFDIRPGKKELPPIPAEGINLSETAEIDNQLCLTSAGCSDFCSRAASVFQNNEGFKKSLGGVHLLDLTEANGSAVKNIKNTAESLDRSVVVWKTFTLGVLSVEDGLFERGEWWNHVTAETVFELRFPKPRRSQQ